jgi:hypothetical protein
MACLIGLSRRRVRLERGYALLAITTSAMALWLACDVLINWHGLHIATIAAHNYLLFVPLGFLVPRLLRGLDADQEKSLIRWVFVVGVVVGLSALASTVRQSGVLFQPIDADVTGIHTFLQTNVELRAGLLGTAERLARLSLLTFVVAASVLLSHRVAGRRFRRLGWACLILSTVAIIVSARRLPLALALIGGAAMVLLARRALPTRFRLAVLIVGVSALVSFYTIQETQFGRFLEQGQREAPTRIEDALTISDSGVAGRGAGTASSGLNEQEAREWTAPAKDSGLDRLTVELGYGGLVLGLAWGLSIMVVCWRAARSGDPLRRAAGIYAGLLLLWYLKAFQTFGDPASLAMFWISVGVALSRPPILEAPDSAVLEHRRPQSLPIMPASRKGEL